VFAVFRLFLLSRFDRILSDPGDGRLYVTILGHWVKVFRGQAQVASPSFFFPQRGVLGYSDTVFLDAIPFAVLRLLGMDRYLAFQGTMMFLTGIGFASMLWLLRRLLRLNPWMQIAGALLFTVSNIYYIQILHAQFVLVAFVPLLCLLAIEYWRAGGRNLARFYITTLGILLALLLYSSFYIGWFTILAGATVLVFLGVCSILSERSTWPVKRGAQLLWMRKSDLLLGLGAFALALVPFLALYLPVLRQTKGRSLGDALFYMPGPFGGFDVSTRNLIWGGLARRIEDAWTPGGVREYPTGWPMLTVCVFVASASYFISRLYRSRHSPYSVEKQLSLLLSATSLACTALCFGSVKVHGSLTAWAIVWKLVPGASAIRVPQRIGLVLNVGVVLVCVAGVNAFLKAQSSHRVLARLVAVLLPLALLAEQVNSAQTHNISRLAEAQRFEKIPPPPKGCSSFFISDEGTETVNAMVTQTDDMLIAQQFDIPTVNGYSGWSPKGWNLFQAGDDGGDAAIRWAQRRGINRGLCGLDFAQRSWFPVDLQKPRGLLAMSSQIIPGLVKNPSFEGGDLSAWGTYQSVEIGLSSAHAHTGTYSLMQTAGEGSVYQDVTGLQPGREYGIAAWVAASRDATATAEIAVWDPGTNVSTGTAPMSPEPVWRPIELAVTASAGGTLRIHLFRGRGEGVIYWDDVCVYLIK